MIRRIAFSITIALASAFGIAAQSLDDAKQAYADGDYAEALPALRAAADAQPRNAAVNMMAGIAMLRTGMTNEAERYLSRGGNDAKVALAELEYMRYRFDEAEEHLDSYEAALKKARKKTDPQEETVNALRRRINNARPMMDRVEKIAVIDSIAVDREDFFKAYRLSSAAGSLLGPEALPADTEAATPTAVYVTENGDRMIWAAPDADENFRLVQTSRLADGTWEPVTPLGDILAEGGDCNYPFLMPDGVTLYFANDGENSLGGYDIFISRFNGEGFLQPQNVGMPYNSPYDDYLLAIDEATGAGWWATDRNRLGDSITIYVFIPQELRKNYDVDTDDLAGLALLTSISRTQQPDADYTDVMRAIARTKEKTSGARQNEMRLGLPDGRVITSPSQLHSPAARSLAQRYASTARELEQCVAELEKMRREYTSGSSTIAPSIRQKESQETQLRQSLRRLAADISQTECN